MLPRPYRRGFQFEIPGCWEIRIWSVLNSMALPWLDVRTAKARRRAWLLTLWSGHKYAALKISTQLRRFPKKRRAELTVYERLCKVESSHPGQAYVRELYDAFEVSDTHGCHQCLIQQPMHLSIFDMLRLNSEPLNEPLLREILKRLLTVLDFLHTEAHITHTGSYNVLLNKPH